MPDIEPAEKFRAHLRLSGAAKRRHDEDGQESPIRADEDQERRDWTTDRDIKISEK
jgi:hypothetical protein